MSKKNKKSNKDISKKAKKARQLQKLKKRGKSKYCEVRESDIHGSGVYAACDIEQGQRIIEYVGEKIDKDESEKRALIQHERAEKYGEASVYIFTLSKKWDIDGSFDWNTARLLNHSCEPNCETWIEGKHIYIYALREIWQGEELTFDYGFDIECFEDHPCRCGSKGCKGYIVSQEQWGELEQRLAEKEGIPVESAEESSSEVAAI